MTCTRRCLLFALVAATASCTGCTNVWHNMQPHRLQQLNRGPGMPTGPEAYSDAGRPVRCDRALS